jgi:hypothetical protein
MNEPATRTEPGARDKPVNQKEANAAPAPQDCRCHRRRPPPHPRHPPHGQIVPPSGKPAEITRTSACVFIPRQAARLARVIHLPVRCTPRSRNSLHMPDRARQAGMQHADGSHTWVRSGSVQCAGVYKVRYVLLRGRDWGCLLEPNPTEPPSGTGFPPQKLPTVSGSRGATQQHMRIISAGPR